ncbi:bifunctional 4-hydroxy-2-oxoglutarate aldolase/2-dehydro-3-deoxy-phosphogluconate aldolase [Pseudonocardia sp. CA-107938]|uniref:bifunctional 4-hydroxy-2-oxoglutarate aldolase/2-dehydro-3-deoxy-phosphogluconate aldolase n=1 Tax=Pseudonocardia sp. CA-107938 TaxID=3240021 RepID=UPI003D8DB2F5
MTPTALQGRVIAVVRAPAIPDVHGLVAALAAGGIPTVELTFTTPDVLRHVTAARDAGTPVGVGTVLTAEQATAAVDAGAAFLVTPGIRAEVAEVGVAAGVPVYLGAFTPTEVAAAVDLGATAVKIFPAGLHGPRYLSDLRGPFPDVPLLPSGGVNEQNAAAFLAAGAVAVCAGTGVVPPQAVAAGDWADITARATRFTTLMEGPG